MGGEWGEKDTLPNRSIFAAELAAVLPSTCGPVLPNSVCLQHRRRTCFPTSSLPPPTLALAQRSSCAEAIPTASFKIANGHPSPSLYADLLFFIAVTTNGQTVCTGCLLSPFQGEPRTSVTSCLMHCVYIHTHTYTRVYTQMLRVHMSVFSYILSTCHITGSQRIGINESYVHIDYKISLNFRNVKTVGKKMYSS